MTFLTLTMNFNPRSREGSDIRIRIQNNIARDFNPRSREGSDAYACRHGKTAEHFNPRSREGSDVPPVYPSNIREISIHAPAKGATKSENSQPCYHSHFNPRSREGSDVLSLPRFCGPRTISIHAPAKGATHSAAVHDPAR